MAILQINGIDIPDPSSLKVGVNDIDGDNSQRNAAGDLTRDRVAVKRKLECEWPALTNEDISTVLTAVKDVFFQCKFPDPEEGQIITKTCYVSDRSAAVYWKDPKTGQYLWKGLSFSIIEK
ncbi:hypothetical protein IAI10_02025 [Clostridium sp. 19966]|uniref:DUF6711 family protein n=1 Tax=Clostridium sp. 19966 TaxID=2768166 RepID=UPI0028DF52BC|nr:DUF6711 family protein [Clostridium sp. 19966]MDT8715434.1 hypothetical protein [Clostridium sp. 19966]